MDPVPRVAGRHLYALVTGVALLYYPFGNQVWLAVFSSLLTYVTMVVAPKLAGRLAWCIAFPFLLIRCARLRFTRLWNCDKAREQQSTCKGSLDALYCA